MWFSTCCNGFSEEFRHTPRMPRMNSWLSERHVASSVRLALRWWDFTHNFASKCVTMALNSRFHMGLDVLLLICTLSDVILHLSVFTFTILAVFTLIYRKRKDESGWLVMMPFIQGLSLVSCFLIIQPDHFNYILPNSEFG